MAMTRLKVAAREYERHCKHKSFGNSTVFFVCFMRFVKIKFRNPSRAAINFGFVFEEEVQPVRTGIPQNDDDDDNSGCAGENFSF